MDLKFCFQIKKKGAYSTGLLGKKLYKNHNKNLFIVRQSRNPRVEIPLPSSLAVEVLTELEIIYLL